MIETPLEKSRKRWKSNEIEKVISLRESGMTFVDIAKLYSLSTVRIRCVYLEALRRKKYREGL